MSLASAVAEPLHRQLFGLIEGMIRQGRKADVRTLKCSTSQVISPNGLTAGEYIARLRGEGGQLAPGGCRALRPRGYPARLETRTQNAAGAAPVASGWSGRRVGLAPTGKRRLVTAHTQSGHSVPRDNSIHPFNEWNQFILFCVFP